MSDPVSQLKQELLAAAERQQGHEVPIWRIRHWWSERSRVHDPRRRLFHVFAVAAFVVAIGTTSAIGGVREFILDRGFIGLPPHGATPSAPESGELVVRWRGISATLPPQRFRFVRVWVYSDGRIIWDREIRDREGQAPEDANEFTSGYLEQRLTPKGVELVRSEIVGLFGRSRTLLETVPDDPRPSPFRGLALFVPPGFRSGGSMEVPEGGRFVRLQWQSIGGNAKEVAHLRKHFRGSIATPEQLSALRRIDALLTDSASAMPSSAWAVREARAYVPSHYAVCIGNVNPPPKDASYLLSLLPARAADVLSDKNPTRFEGEVVDASRDPRKGGIVVLGRSATYCSKLTIEEAREVVEALSGLRRNPGWGHNSLVYRVGERVTGGSEANIWFEPYFPHGRFHFPPGG